MLSNEVFAMTFISRRSEVQSSPFPPGRRPLWAGGRVTFLSPVESPSALSSGPKGLQVERLTLLVSQQVLDETSNGSAGASGMIIHILKLSIGYVLLIQRYVKLTLDFGARPFCIPKKTNKLWVCLRIESFRNIVQGGSGFSPAAGLKSGQFNQKRNFVLDGVSYERFRVAFFFVNLYASVHRFRVHRSGLAFFR